MCNYRHNWYLTRKPLYVILRNYMCIICVQIDKERMTGQEAWDVLIKGEFKAEPEHEEELASKVFDKLLEEA